MCVLTRSLLELLTKNYKNMYLICFYLLHSYNPSFLIYVCFNKVSFRGQKKLGHAQIGLLEGFNSKFPTSIPTPFICRVPPPGFLLTSILTFLCIRVNVCLILVFIIIVLDLSLIFEDLPLLLCCKYYLERLGTYLESNALLSSFKAQDI